MVVLGASGTYPKPDGACTGYLLRSGGHHIWMDAGSGTFANLQRHTDPNSLKAVMISHLHIDHILELYSLYYAIRFGAGGQGPRGLQIFAPARAEAHLQQLVSPTGPDGFGGYYDFKTVRSGDKISLEPFVFTFLRSVHPIECLSMRVQASGRTLAYTSDTGWNDELIEFSRGADVLIAEASLQAPNPAMTQVHLTAEQAGSLAEKAGVGRLVLTHIVPGLDPNVSLEQASTQFHGEILLAIDNAVFEV